MAVLHFLKGAEFGDTASGKGGLGARVYFVILSVETYQIAEIQPCHTRDFRLSTDKSSGGQVTRRSYLSGELRIGDWLGF